MSRRLCTVFRSARVEGMYLYVDRAEGVARVPEPLMQRFGNPEQVMILPLHPERKLARADAARVLELIETQGYYLQMPPKEPGHEQP